jgi:hypothetical protein
MALRDILQRHVNSVAIGAKRTSMSELGWMAQSRSTRSGIRLGAVAIATIKSVPLGKV